MALQIISVCLLAKDNDGLSRCSATGLYSFIDKPLMEKALPQGRERSLQIQGQ